MQKKIRLFIGLVLVFVLPSALTAVADDQHSHIEEVHVTGSPIGRSQFDIVQSTAVLTGDELDAELGGNLGETLEHIPGISNSFFGPGAGRPIVRGLGGDRIRVLVGGIGTIDASSTSPDHAVAGDPLSAQSIEIIRGPATLLYGNNALGGVINLLDGRIPFKRIENSYEGAVRTIFSSNADEINIAGSLDVGVAENIVMHFEGAKRDAQNMTIPGFARSQALRLADPFLAEVKNQVPNSHLENSNFNVGGSVFFDDGFIGISVGSLDNDYGIPVTFEEDGENVRINVEQTRFDLMGELEREFLIFEKAKIRFGLGDYEHRELEGADVGTIFLNNGWEGRVELVQITKALGESNWLLDGAMGLQIKTRDFEAIGDEAFVPPSTTDQFGFFIMEEWANDATTYQLGGRIEFQKVKAPSLTMEKDYTGLSLSAGFSHLLSHELLFGFTAHRTERNPNAEELFSNGPHIATQTFEIGNSNLEKEVATGGEITLRKREGTITGSISVFYNSFDNFIFEDFSGEIIDGLPVGRFAQADAEFYGGEIELNWLAWQENDYSLSFDLGADMVRATKTATATPLPKIPPHSMTIAGEFSADKYSIRLEGEWVAAQNKIDPMETKTDGYFRLDSSVTMHPFNKREDIVIVFQAKNITNAEIRYHNSFLKELLPAPGRDFRLSLRLEF